MICSTGASSVQSIHINEDNLVQWKRAKLQTNGTFVNSGTGSWSLKDPDGNELATGALSYVTGTNGTWQGTIDQLDVADLSEGTPYYLEISLADNLGSDGFRRLQLIARYHGAEA